MNIIHQLLHALKNPTSKLGYKTSAGLYVFFIALAVLWEHVLDYSAFTYYQEYDFFGLTILANIILLRVIFKGLDQWFLIFFLCLAYIAFIHFRDTANHVFLSLFLLAPIAFFPKEYSSETYSTFVRRTLGIVMIAAATQKLISGNFLNGAFLKYFASGYDLNQIVFEAICINQPIMDCDAIIYISIISVIWQYAIGLLLLFNCRHIAAFIAELLFVLGIGVLADEMNFQTVNIAALLIAFRIPAAPIIFIVLLGFLIIDTFTITGIMSVLLQ